MMSSPSREARDLVDLRTDAEAAARDGSERLRTVAEKLALGTATVGVFGLDPIGLEFVVAAGADGARVVAVDADPDATPETLSADARRVLASLPESRVGHQPTALLAADVVVVSAPGTSDPVAAAAGLRAGQLVLVASDHAPGEEADASVDRMLDAARLVRGEDVAVAWIAVGSEADVTGSDRFAADLAQRFLASLPATEPTNVVTLVDDDRVEETVEQAAGEARAREMSIREAALLSSIDHAALATVSVSVLLPCHNEVTTIGNVVRSFRAALPNAAVYVYDNASTDGTDVAAREAGAIVRHSPALGKGNVVRRMFAEIDADVYVLADGDETYEVGAAPELIRQLRTRFLDMVVGRRVESADAAFAYPPGHRFGNRMLTGIVQRLFGATCEDMLSGYRVFSRRYVKSFPAFSRGFETETEMTVHALDLAMPFAEVETEYRVRPTESTSKLRTIPDGLRIARFILRLWKEYEPLRFFGTLALLSGVLAAITALFGPRILTPTLAGQLAIAWCGLGIVLATAGVILDTVSRSRREIKRIMYLAQPYGLPRLHSSRGDSPVDGVTKVEEAGALPGPIDVIA
jgi:hypothetical protein